MDNLQAVIDAARAGAETKTLHEDGHVMVVYVPGHGDHPGRTEVVTKATLEPYRATGAVAVFDAVSLSTLIAVNSYAHTTVYVDRNPTKPAIVAVLNDHGRDGPGWRDHRVSIQFRKTPQWEKWSAIDGKFLSQMEFANFVEDNLLDIVTPAPADMLEISQHLEVIRTTSFKSSSRPKSGLVKFRNESDDTTAENVTIPDALVLELAPFVGSPKSLITARFRYRIEGGGLKLGVKLQRIEEVVAEVMDAIVAAIDLPEGAVMVEGVAP